jgi:hypothetical protein
MTIDESKRSRARGCSRCGYTLMEMITVQAVLVALVAISWPALRGSLQKNVLVDSARQVRTELLKTRQTAMETGVAHQFVYQPGGSEFGILEAAAPGGGLGMRESDRTSGSASPRSTATSALSLDNKDAAKEVRRRLPSEIHFVRPSLDDQTRSQSAAAASNNHSTRSIADEDTAAPPIVFFPNGRTSNARIRLAGKDRHVVELALRGVTGTVTIGDVRHETDDVKDDGAPIGESDGSGRRALGRAEVR